jgi:hypothetical protein
VLEVGTRRILHWNVTEHPTAEWTAQQFRSFRTGDEPYRFIVHDRDAGFSPAVDNVCGAALEEFREFGKVLGGTSDATAIEMASALGELDGPLLLRIFIEEGQRTALHLADLLQWPAHFPDVPQPAGLLVILCITGKGDSWLSRLRRGRFRG